MPGEHRYSQTTEGRRLRQRRARWAYYLRHLERTGEDGYPCRHCPACLPTARGRATHEGRMHVGSSTDPTSTLTGGTSEEYDQTTPEKGGTGDE